MPVPPYEHPLNLTMQSAVTFILWPLSVLILLVAIRQAIRERNPFNVFIVLAIAFGSLIEPLYDISYHLLRYVPGQWTLFSAFELPQPIWVMAAYIVVFAGPTMYIVLTLEKEVTRRSLYKLAAMSALTTAIFEITANNLDLYGYYGPHPFRFLKYPLWVAILEGVQITCFAIACVWLKQRAGNRVLPMLAVFVLFPANFCYTTLGAGFPGLIAINMTEPSSLLLYGSTLLSIGFGLLAVWIMSLLLLDVDGKPLRHA